jgi:NADH:ubiquinone oxidoreductase subunit D
MESTQVNNPASLKDHFDKGFSYVIDSCLDSNNFERFILLNLHQSKIQLTTPYEVKYFTKRYSRSQQYKTLLKEVSKLRKESKGYYRHLYEGNLLHGQDEFFLKIEECLIKECIPCVDRKIFPVQNKLVGKNIRNVLPLVSVLSSYTSQTQQIAYAMLLEKIYDIDIPDRAKGIRMIILELSRILDHLRYVINLAKEMKLNSLFSQATRTYQTARGILKDYLQHRSQLHVGTFGGCLHDFSNIWIAKTLEELKFIKDDCSKILNNYTTSSAFVEPLRCGQLRLEDALQSGSSGPLLRASGANFDLRKRMPYYFYDSLEFEVPIGNEGTCYDRFLVRIEEIRESINMIVQIIEKYTCWCNNRTRAKRAIRSTR